MPVTRACFFCHIDSEETCLKLTVLFFLSDSTHLSKLPDAWTLQTHLQIVDKFLYTKRSFSFSIENFTWILLNVPLRTFFSKQMKLISIIIFWVWTLLRGTSQRLLAFQCIQINRCKGGREDERKFAFFLIAKY